MDLTLLFISFLVLWIGAGISISGVEKVSQHVRVSSFILSFFALGFLTSISEISVAFFSVVDKAPGISVGNLIGGSAVLTLLFIPLLALFNKSLKFDEKSEPINFPLAYLIISLPVLLILDKTISYIDAVIMIASFIFLAVTISIRNTLFSKIEDAINRRSVNMLKEISKILLGVFLIIFSCKYIVDTTVLYANKFSIAPFIIGMLLISIGTNLPELTILIRSTLLKKKAIALGDYVGSAALNTMILGIMTLFNGGSVNLTGGINYNLLLLPLGAVLFLIFTRNKKLERSEGIVLIMLFILFALLEVRR